jgi:hypothetical protein
LGGGQGQGLHRRCLGKGASIGVGKGPTAGSSLRLCASGSSGGPRGLCSITRAALDRSIARPSRSAKSPFYDRCGGELWMNIRRCFDGCSHPNRQRLGPFMPCR